MTGAPRGQNLQAIFADLEWIPWTAFAVPPEDQINPANFQSRPQRMRAVFVGLTAYLFLIACGARALRR